MTVPMITVKVGDTVAYRDRHGRTKAALIVATPESMPEGDAMSGCEAPDEGHAHLFVFSFTGSHYPSYNIPVGDGPHTFTP